MELCSKRLKNKVGLEIKKLNKLIKSLKLRSTIKSFILREIKLLKTLFLWTAIIRLILKLRFHWVWLISIFALRAELRLTKEIRLNILTFSKIYQCLIKKKFKKIWFHKLPNQIHLWMHQAIPETRIKNQNLVEFKINNIIHIHQFQSMDKAKFKTHNLKIKEDNQRAQLLQIIFSTETNHLEQPKVVKILPLPIKATSNNP